MYYRIDKKRTAQPISPRGQYRELLIWAVLAALIWPFHTAHAYVDPGTGSFIVQILIGVFFGAAYAVRRFWSTIAGWFKKKPAKPSTAPIDQKKPEGQ